MCYEAVRVRWIPRFGRLSATSCSVIVLLSSALSIGCNDAATKPTKKPDQHAAHAHADEGLHHGRLIELGNEEYHAELTHDDAAHRVTIYLLDGAVKKSVAIPERELTLNLVVDGKPLQFKLPAAPQADDPVGQSSRFELVEPALVEAIDAPKSTGRINVTIAGKQYSGEVSHHGHADHE